MRILQLASHLDVGGISSHVVALSEALAKRGHQTVVASSGGAWSERLARSGVPHWGISLRTSAEFGPKVAYACWRLSRRLSVQPFELIHAHTRVAQVVACWLFRRYGIPYVATWHGFYRRRLSRRLFPCEGLLTIAISRQVMRYLLEVFGVPEERIRLIPNGVDAAHFAAIPDASALSAFRLRWGIQNHRPVIGWIGRLASGGVKGSDLFLASVQLVRRQIPNIEAVIVGDGPRRCFLERQAASLGLADCVHFVGITDDVRLPLALMDVFVFSSRWTEGFGLSLVEAMAAGKPVVATRNGSVVDIVRHGRDGWLADPESASSLAEGIARLLEDREMAAALGREAQARARGAFSLDRMVAQTEQVYEEVLRGTS